MRRLALGKKYSGSFCESPLCTTPCGKRWAEVGTGAETHPPGAPLALAGRGATRRNHERCHPAAVCLFSTSESRLSLGTPAQSVTLPLASPWGAKTQVLPPLFSTLLHLPLLSPLLLLAPTHCLNSVHWFLCCRLS